jgi:hypothetical protein
VWWALATLACNAPSRDGLFSSAGSRSNSMAGSAGSGGGGGAETGTAGTGGSGGAANAGRGGSSSGGGSGGPAGANGGQAGLDDGGVGDPLEDAGAALDASELPVVVVPSGPLCEGALVDGICWYLGPEDESCDEACAQHAGFNPAASAVIGTTAQGGDIASCSALLDVLLGNADEATVPGTQIEGAGVGCHLYAAADDTRWWLESPDFSPAQSLVGARVVCGCNE